MPVSIESFLHENSDALSAWGRFVSKKIVDKFSKLLKQPCEPRLKEEKSAIAKQLRKRYLNPAVEMTDLIGARIVVLTYEQLRPIKEFIESEASWTAIQSRDFAAEVAANPRLFDYQSHHFEVRPSESMDVDGVSVDATHCCEIQLRTLLQHAYAELVHSNIYKPEGGVPSQAERLVARSMALMETTDELFCQALASIEQLNAPVAALVEQAIVITGDLDESSRKLGFVLCEAYRAQIDEQSVDSINAFADVRHALVAGINNRNAGLFLYPSVALLTYWLSSRLEAEVISGWPFPTLSRDVELTLSDLGIAC